MIAVSRLIPLGRAAFPYAAGVAEMPFAKFITFAVIGSVVWMTGLAFLGREVGADWQQLAQPPRVRRLRGRWQSIVLGIAYLVLRRRRSNRRPPPAVDVASK